MTFAHAPDLHEVALVGALADEEFDDGALLLLAAAQLDALGVHRLGEALERRYGRLQIVGAQPGRVSFCKQNPHI